MLWTTKFDIRLITLMFTYSLNPSLSTIKCRMGLESPEVKVFDARMTASPKYYYYYMPKKWVRTLLKLWKPNYVPMQVYLHLLALSPNSPVHELCKLPDLTSFIQLYVHRWFTGWKLRDEVIQHNLYMTVASITLSCNQMYFSLFLWQNMASSQS